MTLQEELDLANLRYNEIADNYNRVKEERAKISKLAEDFINAPKDVQEAASSAMKDVLTKYKQLGEQEKGLLNEIYGATDKIAALQNQIISQPAVTTRRVNGGGGSGGGGGTVSVDVRGDLLGYLPPNYRGTGVRALKKGAGGDTDVAPVTWEDIYNAGGWNEFKKGFNNALVDDLVLPVADAFGASDDTKAILSELKIPATEREMASKYYAYGGRGKDAADSALQYLGMRGLASIPSLLGAGKTAQTTYNVANSGRGIYNTPNAWNAVNRAGSNYIPAYVSKGLASTNSAVGAASKFANGRTIPEAANKAFWNYANGAGNNMSMMDVLNTYLK